MAPAVDLVAPPAPVARQETGPVPLVEDQPRRRHHTTLPRLLCVTGHAAWLVLPAVFVLMARQGRIYFRTDDSLFIDEHSEKILGVIVAVGVFGYLIGWLWWTVAALLNARHKSRYTAWPGVAWGALVVQVGAAFTSQLKPDDEFARFAVTTVSLLVMAGAHFWVLGSVRRTAAAVKAPQDAWTRMIALPIVAAAAVVVAVFFTRWLGRPAAIGVMVAMYGLVIWYVASVYAALTSFDRACVGRMSMGQDDHALAHFRFHRS